MIGVRGLDRTEMERQGWEALEGRQLSCAGLWPGQGDSSGFPHASPSAHSDILNSPKLSPELQGVRLGTLLPQTQIRQLEATFLSNEVVSPGPVPGGAEGGEQGAWQGRPVGFALP